MPFDLRVRYYSTPTAKGRILPTQTIDFSPVLNSPAVLRFSLSERAAGYLPAGFVVAVEYRSRSGAWLEPRNGRFLVEADEGDDATESGIVQYVGMHLIPWLLGKNELAWSASAKDGARSWDDRSPGYIMNTFLVEAKNRGWAPFLTYDFTGSVTSEGATWPTETRLDATHPLRTKARDVLEAMTAGGLCDWSTQGNELVMSLYGSGLDRTTGPGAVLLGHGATKRVGRSSFSDVFTDLTVIPEKSRYWVYLNNPGAPSTFGRLEETLTLDGIASQTTATRLAQPHLQLGRSARREYSVTYTSANASHVPFDDYNLGDLVRVETRQGIQNLRVVEITCQRDTAGVATITVAFEYRFRSLTARLAGRVGAASAGRIVGGASGRPIPSAPPLANPEPKAPTGFVVESNVGTYDLEGTPISTVTLDWDPVAQAIDDSSIDVEIFELWLAESGGARRRVTGTTSPGAVLTLRPDVEYVAEVRARSVSGLWSAFSTPLLFVGARSSTPIGTPSTPTIFGGVGQIVVEWNGLLASGAAVPAQFRYAYAEIATSAGGPWEYAGGTFTEGGTVIGGLTPGQTYFVRLRLVDSNRLVSAPSASASIMVTPGPSAPTGLTVASNVAEYDEQGIGRARVTITWPAVTTAVNGAPVTVQAYEIFLGQGTDEPTLLTATAATSVELLLPRDTDFVMRIRAIAGDLQESAFSADLAFTTATDATPLAAPTVPVLTTSLGAVRVAWDGMLTTGAPPPRFRRAFAAISDLEEGTYTAAGPSFVSGGTVLTGLPIGEIVYVRLYAIDSNGVISPGSEPSAVFVQGVVDGDVTSGAIGPDALALGAVTTPAIAAGAVEAEQLAANSVQAVHIAAGEVQTYHLSALVGQDLDISSNTSVNLLVGQIEAVQGSVDETSATVESMATYYRFGVDGAEITSPGSPYSFFMSDEGAEIRELGVPVSVWRAGQMEVTAAVVDRVVLGNHQIEKTGTDTVVRAL